MKFLSMLPPKEIQIGCNKFQELLQERISNRQEKIGGDIAKTELTERKNFHVLLATLKHVNTKCSWLHVKVKIAKTQCNSA